MTSRDSASAIWHRSFPFYSTLFQGYTNLGCQVVRVTNNNNNNNNYYYYYYYWSPPPVTPNTCGVFSTEPASGHCSGALNFEMLPTFLEDLWARVQLYSTLRLFHNLPALRTLSTCVHVALTFLYTLKLSTMKTLPKFDVIHRIWRNWKIIQNCG